VIVREHTCYNNTCKNTPESVTYYLNGPTRSEQVMYRFKNIWEEIIQWKIFPWNHDLNSYLNFLLWIVEQMLPNSCLGLHLTQATFLTKMANHIFKITRHHLSKAVFFNLGSANSLQGSMRILKLALFLVSWFRQKFNNVSKVPRHEKGWKALV